METEVSLYNALETFKASTYEGLRERVIFKKGCYSRDHFWKKRDKQETENIAEPEDDIVHSDRLVLRRMAVPLVHLPIMA